MGCISEVISRRGAQGAELNGLYYGGYYTQRPEGAELNGLYYGGYFMQRALRAQS